MKPVLIHNRFDTYLLSNFTDLNKTQIYKMPYRDSPYYEIKIVTSFIYFSLFEPNEHTEDYHN